MTLKELSQLYYLPREIEMDTERLIKLESASKPGATALAGLPHGSGTSDRVGKSATEIVVLRQIIEDKRERCIAECSRLERWIADVPDSLVRQILTERCVNNRTWEEVADVIKHGTTPEGVRKLCARYLRELE